MIVKLLLILALAGAGLFVLRGAGSSGHLAIRRIGAIGFVAAAVLSVLFPDMVTWVANRIGVGRGSDLLLYCLIIAFVFIALGLYQRIQLVESRMVALTRALALASGDHPEESQPADDASATREGVQ